MYLLQVRIKFKFVYCFFNIRCNFILNIVGLYVHSPHTPSWRSVYLVKHRKHQLLLNLQVDVQ
jgi:hypothetical protein